MAKKGKSGPLAALTRILYLPFYYPTYWLLWLLVDIVGGGKIPYVATFLMKQKKIKDAVGFLKEFRGVLQQYLGMPGAPSDSKRCKNCRKPGKFWCVDCGKKFCPQCTINMHAPGTGSEQHSVEELTDHWKPQGVHLVSPILPELLAVLGFSWIYNYVPMFSEDYLTRADMCVVVNSIRQASASLDPHLFYWYKASFTSWCNYEDSFWKLLTDAWVRGVVTETDSTLLVFMNLPQALLFEVVVVIVMVPMLSLLYAVLVNLIWQIEMNLPETEVLKKAEIVSNFFNITSHQYIGSACSALEDMDRKAPDTKPRRREATDFVDDWSYWYGRKMKYFRYFHKTTSASLRYFAWQVTMTVVCFRLACVWFGLGGLIRGFCAALGGQTTIAAHQKWFQDAAGRMLVSENALWGTASALPDVFHAFISVMPEPVTRSSWYLFQILCVGWVLVAVAICSFSVIIVYQRREFQTRWQHGGRDMALDFLQETVGDDEKVKVPTSHRNGKRFAFSVFWRGGA